jgi:hypothetical protein
VVAAAAEAAAAGTAAAEVAAAAGSASGSGSVAAGSVVAPVARVAAHPGERAACAKSHDLTAGLTKDSCAAAREKVLEKPDALFARSRHLEDVR